MDKLTKAEQYAEDVRDKRILTCELVQLAVQRYYNDLQNALDKGWYFDRKAAMRAIKFIETLKHTKGEWAGQKFILEPWQHFILWNIFGWKNADGMRRFRYVYVEIARKNGKTALSAEARKLLSPQGFLYTFLEIRMLYQTYEDAYEMLEEQVERITGKRMYSEYDSFRTVYLRLKTKKRSPK